MAPGSGSPLRLRASGDCGGVGAGAAGSGAPFRHRDGAYAHEEYTIAQSLRTRGALGADQDFLLTGNSSPPGAGALGPESLALLRNGAAGYGGKRDDDSSVDGGESLEPSPERLRAGSAGGSVLVAGGGGGSRPPAASDVRPETASSLGSGSFSSLPTHSRPGSSHARGGNRGGSGAPAAGASLLLHARPGTAASSASDLTHGDAAVLFVGSVARSMRHKRGVVAGGAGGGGGAADRSAGSNASVFRERERIGDTDADVDASVLSALDATALGAIGGGGGAESSFASLSCFRSVGSGGFAPDGGHAAGANESLLLANLSASSAFGVGAGPGARAVSGAVGSSASASFSLAPGETPLWFASAKNNPRERPATAPAPGRERERERERVLSGRAAVAAAGSAAAALGLAMRRSGGSGGGGGGGLGEEEEAEGEDSSEGESVRGIGGIGGGARRAAKAAAAVAAGASASGGAPSEGKRNDEAARSLQRRRSGGDSLLRAMREQLKGAAAAAAAAQGSGADLARAQVEAPRGGGEAAATTADAAAAAIVSEPGPDVGPAVAMPDAALVELLRQKPKHVPQLHNRSAFRAFFCGMRRARMLALLATAGADKRLELLDGVLRNDDE